MEKHNILFGAKMGIKIDQIADGVYSIGNSIATQNMLPGASVYGEQRLNLNGAEFRIWDPNRSKVGAAIKKGLRNLQITKGSKILYLGAAEGTTISHLSDIIGEEGVIFGVDISARSMRKFIYLCEQRKNLVPILADASQPMTYKENISGFTIDALFQDVSQKNQAEILLKNSRAYLKSGAYAFLSLKARSINSTDPTSAIVEEESKKLENEFEILETINLEPFEKDHAMIVCRRK
ncbi:MAG TPA: fibrillarin-like rRNA/tRNA 2'-O-methyltransferase [archaeon]|nr:fibrillarin-like rRNA/tRNA 2'-O-methyltransferase [archaeon]